MSKTSELYLVVIGTVILSFIGVAALAYISYIRPLADNTQLNVMICGFLAPTILVYANWVKGYQIQTSQARNTEAIAEIKKNTNGLTTQAVNNAATIATLTEKVESANKASSVAAQVAVNTAVALAAKTANSIPALKEDVLNGD